MTPPQPALSDTFRTVAEPCSDSMLVSGSKFIAWLAPLASEGDTESCMTERKRRYSDATHHCWAFRTGRPGPLVERSSDSGEPSGTAGRPIVDSLRRVELENVICIVTRYFGGTKLGTGGLARAYADAAAAAIATAHVVTRTVVQEIAIDFDHERTGPLFRVLDEFDVHLVPGVYDARGHGIVRIPASKVGAFRTRLSEFARTGIDLTPNALLIE